MIAIHQLADEIIRRCSSARHWRANGTNKYRGSSPLRPDSDGDSFSLAIDDESIGLGRWYDFVSAEGGSLLALADRLGIDYEKPNKAPSTSTRAYQTLATYAQAHGVTAEQLASYGWREVTHTNRPALEFGASDGSWKRWRFLDGKRPKFTNQPGAKGYWYNLPRAVARAKQDGTPLYITAGEIDALSGWFHGLATCATTAGEMRTGLHEHLLSEVKRAWQGEVVVIGDCDDVGQAWAATVAGQVGGRALDLKLGDKGDLSDFCTLHGEDAGHVIAQMVAALPSNPTPEKPVSGVPAATIESLGTYTRAVFDLATQSYAGEYPPDAIRTGIPSLDNGMQLLRGGEVMVILGATGMGKSTLATQLIANISAHGAVYIEPTEQTPVQYTARLACNIAGVPLDRLRTPGTMTKDEYGRFADALSIIEKRAIFTPRRPSSPNELHKHIAAAKQRGAVCVVIDSINKLHFPQGGSGQYASMTEASAVIQQISVELDMPVIVTSQIGRKTSGRDELRPQLHDAKNSGAIEEDASFVFGIYNHNYYVEKGLADADLVTHPQGITWLYNLKSRWTGTIKPIALRVVGGTGMTEARVERVDLALDDF